MLLAASSYYVMLLLVMCMMMMVMIRDDGDDGDEEEQEEADHCADSSVNEKGCTILVHDKVLGKSSLFFALQHISHWSCLQLFRSIKLDRVKCYSSPKMLHGPAANHTKVLTMLAFFVAGRFGAEAGGV